MLQMYCFLTWCPMLAGHAVNTISPVIKPSPSPALDFLISTPQPFSLCLQHPVICNLYLSSLLFLLHSSFNGSHPIVFHLPCQLKINPCLDQSLSLCLLISEGQYLAILNSLSSVSLTNTANDVNKHSHTNTHCYHNSGSTAAARGQLLKNLTMWSEQRGKTETSESSVGDVPWRCLLL